MHHPCFKRKVHNKLKLFLYKIMTAFALNPVHCFIPNNKLCWFHLKVTLPVSRKRMNIISSVMFKFFHQLFLTLNIGFLFQRNIIKNKCTKVLLLIFYALETKAKQWITTNYTFQALVLRCGDILIRVISIEENVPVNKGQKNNDLGLPCCYHHWTNRTQWKTN